jgi:hypothetical protein
MATTTNFGWETPDDTDLVKDGAAAIRTALGGVDTSFVDLKGGTTGQVLSKATNTDLDFSWSTPSTAGMTLINTGGTALSGSSVVIGSIPATYKHLLITLKGVYMATAAGSVYLRLNADTGSNYAANGIRNIGTTVLGQFTQSQTQFEIISRNTATNTPRLLSNGTVWLMNYTDTDQISLTAQTYGTETTNTVSLQQTGVYDNSAAISSITLYGDFNFSGGTAYVYGVN